MMAFVVAGAILASPEQTIPFHWLRPGLPIVAFQAKVNGIDATLTLDTGNAESLALSESFAKRLGLKLKARRERGSSFAVGKGIDVKTWSAQVDFVAFANESLANQKVDVSNYVDGLSKTLGVEIDGNIGYGLLKNYRLTIDYHAMTLRFEREPKRNASGTSFEKAKNLMLVDVRVQGKGPYPFILDTGAGATVVSDELATELGLQATQEVPVQGAKGMSKGKLIPQARVELVGAPERSVMVVATDFFADLSRTLGKPVSGILGFNYFKDARLVIDYPNQRVQISK